MSRTLVRDLSAHVGERVTVYGWVNTSRLQRKMQFIVVRDHTGMVQVTNKRTEPASEVEETFERVPTESAVKVTGTVVANPIVKLGGVELVPDAVEVVNAAVSPLPINDQTGIDQRLDWRFLDIRHPARQLIFQVQTTVEAAMREFAYGEGATELHTPKFMGTASESGAEVFKVKYFDRNAYLAQSPQFYKQMAISGGIDKVFEIGPVFRAEPSFTSRHATEFISIDVELAWIDGVEDVMSFEERMLAHVLAAVAEKHGEEIRELLGAEVVVPELPFPRIPMREAIELLTDQGWKPEKVKGDLDPEGERSISALVKERFGHEFVFITEFPAGVRPFYHMRAEGNPDVTESFDLLWKGIEITTGAQREHRYDVLVKQAEEKGMDLEPLSSYTNSFRFGTPPHGGLGAGLSRILMVMLGLDSIRETTFLFRGPNRLEP
ncbi:aspartate--tRNA(Asn) ligase [Actinokineospora iranica]|uniref:Aspartate--tRNA ligase n=1 Tax=Actinokineospora iranica TaxID=1271860 RepID=A0A1G6XN90_9PSEU|nr:aspartate--tRNA(Asn) ligase [Actinokineospora iranica]SDD78817.1 aspartyl-tRNA synthetase [Actinokineospora iranica]